MYFDVEFHVRKWSKTLISVILFKSEIKIKLWDTHGCFITETQAR